MPTSIMVKRKKHLEIRVSEREEAVVRSQAILMITRNIGKEKVIERLMKRFIKCITAG